MERREFIKVSSMAAVLLCTPSLLSAKLTSAPLFIQVHAGGGWDPTMFCDPKPDLNRLGMTVQQVDGTPIKYADFGTESNNIRNFFETYANDLLVINGINAQGNGHVTGVQYATNGKLGTDYPVLPALLSNIYNAESSLGFLKRGSGYFNGAGLATGVDIPFLNTFKRILDPNLLLTNTGVSYQYMSASTLSKIHDALDANENIKQTSETSPSVIDHRKNRQKLFNANKELKKITITDEMEGNEGFFSDIAIAVDGYQKGLTSSILLMNGSFDTHTNHDATHLSALNIFFAQLQQAIAHVQSKIGNNYVLVVSSEFGRTPSYNSNNGKDHWSTTSWLFMGKDIQGGRVIGETTDRHQYTNINPENLQRDDSSAVSITFEQIHMALRELYDIDTHPLCSNIFQLNPSLNKLNLFR